MGRKVKTTHLDDRIAMRRKEIESMIIVDRYIGGDMCATFTLRGANGAGYGPTCVSVMPTGYVAIAGDMDSMVFSVRGSTHWLGALSIFHRGDLGRVPIGYVIEKGAIGMSDSVEEYCIAQAIDDLKQMFKDDDNDNKGDEYREFSVENRTELLDASHDGEHALFEMLYEISPDSLESPPGMVPKACLLNGAMLMSHLTNLLNQEESEEKNGLQCKEVPVTP